MPIRIMIVDSQPIVLIALKNTLQLFEDINVIAVYNNSTDLLTALKEEQPNVLLLDLHLNDPANDLLKTIVRLYPQVKVLMIANQADICLVKETIQIGARGFLTKHEDENIFAQAITYLYLGKVFITDGYGTRVYKTFSR